MDWHQQFPDDPSAMDPSAEQSSPLSLQAAHFRSCSLDTVKVSQVKIEPGLTTLSHEPCGHLLHLLAKEARRVLHVNK